MNEELAEKCRLTDEEIAKLTKPGPYETYFSHYPHIVAQAQLAKAIPLISAEARKQEREGIISWIDKRPIFIQSNSLGVKVPIQADKEYEALKEGGKEADNG